MGAHDIVREVYGASIPLPKRFRIRGYAGWDHWVDMGQHDAHADALVGLRNILTVAERHGLYYRKSSTVQDQWEADVQDLAVMRESGAPEFPSKIKIEHVWDVEPDEPGPDEVLGALANPKAASVPTHGTWIARDGSVVAGGDHHDNTILNNPAIFGLTARQVQQYRRQRREGVGYLGDLVLDVIEQGWIRFGIEARGFYFKSSQMDATTLAVLQDFITIQYPDAPGDTMIMWEDIDGTSEDVPLGQFMSASGPRDFGGHDIQGVKLVQGFDMAAEKAFWVARDGSSLDVDGTHHGQAVEDHPEWFGLTSKDLKNSSLDALSVKAMNKGFIRGFIGPRYAVFASNVAGSRELGSIQDYLLRDIQEGDGDVWAVTWEALDSKFFAQSVEINKFLSASSPGDLASPGRDAMIDRAREVQGSKLAAQALDPTPQIQHLTDQVQNLQSQVQQVAKPQQAPTDADKMSQTQYSPNTDPARAYQPKAKGPTPDQKIENLSDTTNALQQQVQQLQRQGSVWASSPRSCRGGSVFDPPCVERSVAPPVGGQGVGAHLDPLTYFKQASHAQDLAALVAQVKADVASGALDGLVPDMNDFFEDRTDHHIERVRRNLVRLADAGFIDHAVAQQRGDCHDWSKRNPDLTQQYRWLTWGKDRGWRDADYPEGVKPAIDRATKLHVMTEHHHPEAHWTPGAMTPEDLAELASDWCAMGAELGTDTRDWSASKKGVIPLWPTQWALVDAMIEAVADEKLTADERAEDYEDLKRMTGQIVEGSLSSPGARFWISPDGQRHDLVGGAAAEHGNFVRANPKLFGISNQDIKQFKKVNPSNEQFRQIAYRQGWIRGGIWNGGDDAAFSSLRHNSESSGRIQDFLMQHYPDLAPDAWIGWDAQDGTPFIESSVGDFLSASGVGDIAPFRRVEGSVQSGWDLTGQDLPMLYHGGREFINGVDPSRLQSRDAGYYGRGFYCAVRPELVKGYGGRVSGFAVDPGARVLRSALTVAAAPPGLVEAVEAEAHETQFPKAEVRGKGTEWLEELTTIRTSPISWKSAVDGFGVRQGYDIIWHADAEVVVKNLGVICRVPVQRQRKTADVVDPTSTDSPQFTAWFGNSKIVKPDGSPLEVYHGTPESGFSEFTTRPGVSNTNTAGARIGYFFTPNPRSASGYARGGEASGVYPVYLAIQNPLFITFRQNPIDAGAARKLRAFMLQHGYDGLVMGAGSTEGYDAYAPHEGLVASVYGGSGLDFSDSGPIPDIATAHEIVALYPNQIKSVFNQGTYDPSNPVITASARTAGFDEWSSGSQVIDPATGQLVTMYHGTRGEDFNAFETPGLGAHFTPSASTAEFFTQNYGGDTAPGGRIYPVNLAIKNPIRLPDLGSWGPDQVLVSLMDYGPDDLFDSAEEFDRLDRKINRIVETQGSEAANVEIRKFLQRKGYDGIQYLNRYESTDAAATAERLAAEVPDKIRAMGLDPDDPDSIREWLMDPETTDDDVRELLGDRAADAWIAFHPGQIKSVFNRGTYNPRSKNISASVWRPVTAGAQDLQNRQMADRLYFELVRAVKANPTGAKDYMYGYDRVDVRSGDYYFGFMVVPEMKNATFQPPGDDPDSIPRIRLGLRGWWSAPETGGRANWPELLLDIVTRAKGTLIHEITHYLDWARTLGDAIERGARSDVPYAAGDYATYYNTPVEMNAYFQQWASGVVREAKDMTKDHGEPHYTSVDIFIAMKLPDLKRAKWFVALNQDNKRRVMKRLQQLYYDMTNTTVQVKGQKIPLAVAHGASPYQHPVFTYTNILDRPADPVAAPVPEAQGAESPGQEVTASGTYDNFWLAPNGVEVNTEGQAHEEFAVHNYEMFGLTTRDAKAYRTVDAPSYFEKTFKKGWIRGVRGNPMAFESGRMDARTFGVIQDYLMDQIEVNGLSGVGIVWDAWDGSFAAVDSLDDFVSAGSVGDLMNMRRHIARLVQGGQQDQQFRQQARDALAALIDRLMGASLQQRRGLFDPTAGFEMPGYPDIRIMLNPGATYSGLGSLKSDPAISVILIGTGPNSGGIDEMLPVVAPILESKRNDFIHEFIHYLDRNRIGEAAGAVQRQARDAVGAEDADAYYNNPMEYNARFQEMSAWVFDNIDNIAQRRDPEIRDRRFRALYPDFNAFYRTVVDLRLGPGSSLASFWSALTPDNKKRLKKRIAQLWQDVQQYAQEKGVLHDDQGAPLDSLLNNATAMQPDQGA